MVVVGWLPSQWLVVRSSCSCGSSGPPDLIGTCRSTTVPALPNRTFAAKSSWPALTPDPDTHYLLTDTEQAHFTWLCVHTYTPTSQTTISPSLLPTLTLNLFQAAELSSTISSFTANYPRYLIPLLSVIFIAIAAYIESCLSPAFLEEAANMSLKNFVVQPRIYLSPPFSVEAPGYEKVEGETIPRRHPDHKDKLIERPREDVTTLFDITKHSSREYGNAKAVGSRKLVKTHQETKQVKKIVDGEETMVEKKWTYFELGPYEYLSFNEFEKLVLQLGAGYRKLGLTKGDRVHIFAGTSAHWLATAHGAASQSLPIVTAYDTLGAEGLKHSLVATGAKAIFLDPHLLTTLIEPLKEAKEIKTVVWNSQNEVKQENVEKLQAAHPHLTILSFEELRKLGEDNPVDPVPPTPEDLCCIMYTSGSTGPPKGVPLKHKAVVAAGKSKKSHPPLE